MLLRQISGFHILSVNEARAVKRKARRGERSQY